jgi:hypothetical protein
VPPGKLSFLGIDRCPCGSKSTGSRRKTVVGGATLIKAT